MPDAPESLAARGMGDVIIPFLSRVWVCKKCGEWTPDPLDFDAVVCLCGTAGVWYVGHASWPWRRAERFNLRRAGDTQ